MWFVWVLACAGRQEPRPEMPEPMPEEEPEGDIAELPTTPEVAMEDIPAGAIRRVATARLEPKSGSRATGTITLVETVLPPPMPREAQTPTPEEIRTVRVVVDVRDAPPGLHGLHVHENGDCTAPDASSAGGHFNPAGVPHGDMGQPRHPGDFGNLEVGPDGRGHREITTETLTLGPGGLSVIGRAVVLHEQPDDFSQPNGNAGRRIACGVILSQVATLGD